MRIYLVGGAVRDQLLGLPISDKDFVVVGSTPKEMIKNGFKQVGSDFPVFIHPKTNEEYALARTERKIALGYNGFFCNNNKNITIEDDLLRRDLTINAIAQDENGKIVDPYHGYDDIKKRILRHVSPAFVEDSLRVLRVARFAARFYQKGFTVAPETIALMQSKSVLNELLYLKPERIWLETEKALKSDSPEIYIKILRKCGALAIIFPEIEKLFDVSGFKQCKQEIDIGNHTMMVMKIVSKLTSNINVRFAALCHDFGEILTSKKILLSHSNHVENGIQIINGFCKRIKVPTDICDFACLAARFHDKIHIINKLTAIEIVNIFNIMDAWRKSCRIEYLSIVSEADAKGRNGCLYELYPQGDFFRQAFDIAKSISVKSIIKQGFKDFKIREELTKQRIKGIFDWKKHQKLFN
ncbi:multifunctional CCA addition/repair protein [Candidatus Providencia siddallii]|uniref:CCA-adding enzyme n=1 Tax=Candidatus Providencia siddallii TaxID=1715285 RepID=A0ABM9NND3_9GAMM